MGEDESVTFVELAALMRELDKVKPDPKNFAIRVEKGSIMWEWLVEEGIIKEDEDA
jgi:hypothetical protein